MTIRIEAYDRLPDAARAIREQVFIRERDWRPEFDEWDAASAHLLAFDSVDSPDRPGPSAQSASSIQSGQPDQNRPVDVYKRQSYRNGTLCIQVPKMQAQPQVESKHQIAIEG